MKFLWNIMYECVFNNLKKWFIIILIFVYFDFDFECVFEADLSDHVQRNVLSQYDKNNILCSIVFFHENWMLLNQIIRFIIRNYL